jgi:hypothetical protein
MNEFDFDDSMDFGIDAEDYEFLKETKNMLVLQVYNNIGEIEDVYIGYEQIKKFIDDFEKRSSSKS